MNHLGIDLGSTYSSVAFVDSKEPKSLSQYQGGPVNIPSVVKKIGPYYYCGGVAYKHEARRQTLFSSFKMLLAGDNREEATKLHYKTDQTEDGSYRMDADTPSGIASKFINNLVESCYMRSGQKYPIDSLYICVPEIWYTKLSSLDAIRIISDICHRLPNIKAEGIHVVSEPVAASAFFACSFSEFRGDLLLVDFGGGTLDITWTKIDDSSTDCGQIVLSVEGRYGSGANNEGKIGNAGITYMNTVIDLALHDCVAIDDNTINPNSREFLANVDALESNLQLNMVEIDETFRDELGIVYKADDNTMHCNADASKIILENYWNYDDHDFVITYDHLIRAYNKEIAKELQRALSDIVQQMIDQNHYHQKMNDGQRQVQFMDSTSRNFKIAIVGGFGQFSLVRRQVEQFFHQTSTDLRFKETLSPDQSQLAVAYGAALLANGNVLMRDRANFSIGMCLVNNITGTSVISHAVKYGDEIEFGRKYPLRDSAGNIVKIWIDSIPEYLYYSPTREPEPNSNVKLRDDFRAEIASKLAIFSPLDELKIEFSFDTSHMITMHFTQWESDSISVQIPSRSIHRMCITT